MLGRVLRRVHCRSRGASCCSLGLSALSAGLLSRPLGRNAFCTLYVTRHLRDRLLHVPAQSVDLLSQRRDVAFRWGVGRRAGRLGPLSVRWPSGRGANRLARRKLRLGLGGNSHRQIPLGLGGDGIQSLQRNLALMAQALPGTRGGLGDRVVAAGPCRTRRRGPGQCGGRARAGARCGTEPLQEPSDAG